MTDRPILFSDPMIRALLHGRKTQTRRVLKPTLDGFQSPLYRRGDRLWVRECFGFDTPSGLAGLIKVKFRATNGLAVPPFSGWNPSIHMPRKHSRITLTVTDVRVQRVQDISEADAEAEGAPAQEPALDVAPERGLPTTPYRVGFRSLWNSLNEGRGYGWGSNPMVCALTFSVDHCNIDWMGADT
ncbi:hypothetical protein [Tropicibacter alexandrii]|uniref:hypothetical protein n=1 Tax=Tropicibacter alexandrii TaxID=2267683 RepID=UPI0010087F29|nr:hypothetical protein [Tropicibacter alexandrii]